MRDTGAERQEPGAGEAHERECPSGPSRREALKLLLGGALTSGPLSRYTLDASAQGTADVLVGDLAEIPAGSAVSARFHGLPVLVINLDGEPVVLSAICTHEGCMVEWEEGKGEIVCPCHNGRYSEEGQVLEGPPPAPLLNFPLRVEEGKIYVVE